MNRLTEKKPSENEKKDLCPVLLGADMNCYNVARAFHEKYGVISHAFGRYAIGATENTRIVDFHAVEDLTKPEKLTEVLSDFAEKQAGKSLILIGCTDEYAEMISQLKDKLSDRYIIPYSDYELIRKVTNKANFYQLCEKYGIDYPKTTVITAENYKDFVSEYDYPIIIKPSVSADYWKHPFEGMKKVYRAKTPEEAQKIFADIYGSGYPDALIVQDMIPGNDSAMYVLTAYSGEDGKVRAMSLGHVLLEEHTPKGLGNHCAIISAYKPEIYERFVNLLEGEHFVGYSNFDIKFDSRDGSFRAFEINTRQGRSNYYVTAAGANIAENIVSDRIDRTECQKIKITTDEIYWRYIPDSVVKKYVDKHTAEKIDKLKKQGKAYSSMRYPFDTKGNAKRKIYIMMHEYRQIEKFKKYLPTDKQ